MKLLSLRILGVAAYFLDTLLLLVQEYVGDRVCNCLGVVVVICIFRLLAKLFISLSKFIWVRIIIFAGKKFWWEACQERKKVNQHRS